MSIFSDVTKFITKKLIPTVGKAFISAQTNVIKGAAGFITGGPEGAISGFTSGIKNILSTAASNKAAGPQIASEMTNSIPSVPTKPTAVVSATSKSISGMPSNRGEGIFSAVSKIGEILKIQIPGTKSNILNIGGDLVRSIISSPTAKPAAAIIAAAPAAPVSVSSGKVMPPSMPTGAIMYGASNVTNSNMADTRGLFESKAQKEAEAQKAETQKYIRYGLIGLVIYFGLKMLKIIK